MFVLEHKQLYIVKEELTKKQDLPILSMETIRNGEERGPLDDILKKQKRPEDWRVERLAI